LAAGVAHDLAALRVARLARDAGLLQSERVRPVGVAVHAPEEDWVRGRDLVQVTLGRPLAAPQRVIPAAPQNPGAGLHLADARRRCAEDLSGERASAAQNARASVSVSFERRRIF